MSLLGGRTSRRLGALVSVMALTCGNACSSDGESGGADASGGAGGAVNGTGGSGSVNSTGGSTGTGASTSSGSTTGSGGAEGGASNGSGGATSPECGDIVCDNGGVCVADGDSFTCECAGTGFGGATCAENIDECQSAPCQNGGTCEDTAGSFTCDCSGSATHAGQSCDQLRLEVLPSDFLPKNVSPEGNVVVGSNGDLAAKYVGGQQVLLGMFEGDTRSVALAASANGKLIVGASRTTNTDGTTKTSRALLWTIDGSKQLDVPAGKTVCEASDVTPNGTVIVGRCNGSVVRWVDGELEELGAAPNVLGCYDTVLSDDGKVIGGYCEQSGNKRQGFLWTEENGYSLLTSLAGTSQCEVNALSADGTKAAGTCGSDSSAVPTYWTVPGGPIALPMEGGQSFGEAFGISSDGSRIVGTTGGPQVWLDGTLTPLEDLLPALPQELPVLTMALALSADGKTIVGLGSTDSPDYVTKAFVARID